MPSNTGFALDGRLRKSKNLKIGSVSADSFACQTVSVAFMAKNREFVDLIQHHNFHGAKSQWRSTSATNKRHDSVQERFAPNIVRPAG